VQLPHIIHDVFGDPMDAVGDQLNLDLAQIYHHSDALNVHSTPLFN